MLELQIELLNDEPVHSLILGHLTVVGRDSILTSKGKIPAQGMMIFISISELLSGIKRFLLDRNLKQYYFVGVDSSFQFYINKESTKLLITDNKNNKIDQVT